ncbi:phosphotransferase [Halorubrum sp. BOL3-1]|uniref:phosphotransferase family protein n=1 Tax=Halorubrum sp. BOL3-1 TaxID=2497325 RepID=UPI001004DAD6|nr:phosphotransferase [Halorubrum sp. BOL3-1]QAU13311.1 phosphotransferase [Halorubrum sp. BOL3-1]
MSDAVRERALGEARPGATPTSVKAMGRGNRKRTEVVRFDAADPVVVQYSATPEATRTEATLLAAVSGRTGVPVPRPIGEGTVDGTGWMVTPLIEGLDLHGAFVDLGPADRREIARALGRYLAEVHEAFPFSGCGRLAVGGPEGAESVLGSDSPLFVRRPVDAKRWVRRFGERHAERLPSEFDDLRAPIDDALRESTGTDAAPRLFPWDFRPGNALATGGAVTAVLDWEAPLSAPPGVSVAKAEHLVVDWYVPATETEPLRRAFRDGYESVTSLPPVGRAHRAAAVASAVVDVGGAVTNPRYPPVDRDEAVAFHRRAFRRALDGTRE